MFRHILRRLPGVLRSAPRLLPLVRGTHVRAAEEYARAAALISTGEESSMGEARALLHSSASAGNASAVGRLGRWCLYGLYGEPLDVRRGLGMLQRAALDGDVVAAYWLGSSFLRLDELAPGEVLPPMGGCGGGGGGGSKVAGEEEKVPPTIPDPFVPEGLEASAARVAAAQQVVDEIKAMRKRAAVEKRARSKASLGAAAAAASAAAPTATSSSSSFDLSREDLSLVPLTCSTVRGYHWLRLAARADSTQAAVALGNLCMSGIAPLRDGAPPPTDAPTTAALEARAVARVEEAIAWYELAGGVGVGEGEGEGEEISSSSISSSRDAATLGPLPHPDALYNLGQVYWEGVSGVVPQDAVRALDYFNTAASLGDSSALFFLGHLLRVGHEGAGVRRNVKKGLASLERAASAGHGGAAHYLSQFWREGGVGLPPSPARVRHFLGMAGEARVGEALLDLGHAHLTGSDGFPLDVTSAWKYFNAALSAAGAGAGQGEDEEDRDLRLKAHLAAGTMAYKGLGGPVNFPLALSHYRAAAELNSVEAWENIAAMALAGEGMPVDREGAKGILAMVARWKEGGKSPSPPSGGSGGVEEGKNGEEGAAAGGGGAGCGKQSCACAAKQ